MPCQCAVSAYDQSIAKAELVVAVHEKRITVAELWTAYSETGGDMARSEVQATVFGGSPLSQFEYGLLAIAVNELIRRQ